MQENRLIQRICLKNNPFLFEIIFFIFLKSIWIFLIFLSFENIVFWKGLEKFKRIQKN